MSRWANARKARLARPPQLDAVQQLEVRVGHRICEIVHGQACVCKQQGLGHVCDNMKLAAQHAFAEVMGE